MKGKTLLLIRRAHLFLSVFFAPLLLVFIVSGWWQVALTDDQKEEGHGWLHKMFERLSTVHTEGWYPHPGGGTDGHLMFKILAVAMCVAFIISICLGVTLAFQMMKKKWIVALALGLGIVVPAAVLWFA